MKRRELIRHLERNGCTLLREGGNHSIYFNPSNNKISAVGRHTEIADRMAQIICKQLEIPKP